MRNKSELFKSFLFVTVLCLALSLSALAATAWAAQAATSSRTVPPAEPQYGGTFKICTAVDAEQIGDPAARPFSYNSCKIAMTALDTLLRVDDKGLPSPWLAVGWKVSSDLRSVTFNLRKGVKFHDGTDFNAEAAKWNLDRSRLSNSPELKSVASIDVVDPFTIKLNLSRWDSSLIDNLTTVAGFMISPTAFQKSGSTDAERSEYTRSHPVGTGPFRFVRWDRGSKVRYIKFDGYWQKGKPYVDEIEWNVIADEVTRWAALKKGEVHQLFNVEARQVRELQKEGEFNLASCALSSVAIVVMGDSSHPNSPFANLRVRQAVEHAVDKQALVDVLSYGLGKVANQYASPGSWGINPQVKGYSYDPQKAKQLLAEAGYPSGFKTKLIYPNMGVFQNAAAALPGYLKAVGIEVELSPVSGPAHMATLKNGWQNGLCMHPGSLQRPDVSGNMIINASSKAAFTSSVAFPADYDEALQKAVEAQDFNTRQKWTWEAQKLLIDKYALMNFFYTEPKTNAANKKVHDHGTGPTIDSQYTPEDVWLEK